MDPTIVIQKLRTKLSAVPAETKFVIVTPLSWDDELDLGIGETERFLEGAVRGTPFAVTLRDGFVKLVRKS